jgi:hypothetical protein
MFDIEVFHEFIRKGLVAAPGPSRTASRRARFLGSTCRRAGHVGSSEFDPKLPSRGRGLPYFEGKPIQLSRRKFSQP